MVRLDERRRSPEQEVEVLGYPEETSTSVMAGGTAPYNPPIVNTRAYSRRLG